MYTIVGNDMYDYTKEAKLINNQLAFVDGPDHSHDEEVIRPVDSPYDPKGGIVTVDGNLGKAVVKVSAVDKKHWYTRAEACVFNDQYELLEAFKKGDLHKDFVAVLRFQGPKAKGMPELHKLMPILRVLQNLGFQVALVTDGRMSGASGKVPAAIHLSQKHLTTRS